MQAHTAAAGERHRCIPDDTRCAVLSEAACSASAFDQALSAWYEKDNAAARVGGKATGEAAQRLDVLQQSMLDAADIALVSDFMCAA